MLTITSRALSVIRRVTAHPALDRASGLRIAPAIRPDGPLQVRAAHAPEDDDHVLERDGGRVFLAPGVTERIDGGDLDAQKGPNGQVQFVLRGAS